MTAAVIIILIALGTVWDGFSTEVHERVWRDIFGRPSGPMAFCFLAQSAMAAILAVRGEAVVVALLLAFLPYLLIRGLAARIARRWSRSASGTVH